MQANLDQPRRHRGSKAARQVELRAAARRRRAVRARAGDSPCGATAEGPRVRVDPDGRLDAGDRAGRLHDPDRAFGRAAGHSRHSPRSRRSRSDSPRHAAPCSWQAPRSTPAAAGTRRSSWSSLSACRCGRLRRPAAGASASRRTIPPSRGAAAGGGAAGSDARRPRPGARRRLVGVSLLPEHSRRLPAGRRRARRDHERPGRGRARADGRCDRRRRRAHPARARTRARREPV